MKIEIYYNDVPVAPGLDSHGGESVAGDFEENKLNYRFVWSDTDWALDFDKSSDRKTLEMIFDYFNRKKPDDFSGPFRPLLIGDVVSLDDRCYLCQTLDWRKLENFTR